MGLHGMGKTLKGFQPPSPHAHLYQYVPLHHTPTRPIPSLHHYTYLTLHHHSIQSGIWHITASLLWGPHTRGGKKKMFSLSDSTISPVVWNLNHYPTSSSVLLHQSVCVCVCVCVWGGGGWGTNRATALQEA